MAHPRTRSDAFSPIITVAAFVLQLTAVGITEASATRRLAERIEAIALSGSRARVRVRLRCRKIGVSAFPAPPTNFTMGASGTSFYGDIHVCGEGPLHFYTDHKLVVSRW